MLWMLRFCRAIKYRGLWHVDVVRRLGAEGTSRTWEHVLISAGGKVVWPISVEVKQVDWHWEGQTRMEDFSIRVSSFFCLCCSKPKLRATTAKRNESILALGARVHHHTGQHFVYSGEVKRHWALRPQKQLRLIRDGEVGRGGVRNFISETYSLHRHLQSDSALRWAAVWTILMFH